MDILFIHQNFPGQFKNLAPAIAKLGHNVVALTLRKIPAQNWNGVRVIPYKLHRISSRTIHPWLADFESKIIRGEACMRAALYLKSQGFNPQVIIAHPGWGESLFLKDVWPKTKLAIYCEFFYKNEGADINFDSEFSISHLHDKSKLKIKNLNNLLHMQIATAAISPTRWQASTFPFDFQQKISIIHEGVDTNRIRPNPNAHLKINEQFTFTKNDEIITFAARNLEPYRGFHIFMRALPYILIRCPTAHILIVGEEGCSYGNRPPQGKSWKQIFTKEVKNQIADSDWQRVHFLGKIDYPEFISLLQISSVHIYLTYPFVLSWSLLEAMSAGCTIIASDTAPVREAIANDQTGRLVDFFDPENLATETHELITNPGKRKILGSNAREFIKKHYDLESVCLPRQIQWFRELFS